MVDNVYSGIEPPFILSYDRSVKLSENTHVERVEDYGNRNGVPGLTANEISAQEHLKVLTLATQFVDSGVSKTYNIGDKVTFEDFK